jgi:hypothetical protein
MLHCNFQTVQPTSGQFVIVWRDSRKRLYSSTFKWVDGELKELDTFEEKLQPRLVLPDGEMILGYLT